MQNFSRKKFIIGSAGLILLGPSLVFSAKKKINKTSIEKSEKFLICDAPEGAYGNSNEFVVSDAGSVQIYDLATQKNSQIPLDFFGHTLTFNPDESHIVASFEQYGMRGALIDLKKQKVLKTIKAEAANTFMGHVVFLPGKKQLLTTEHNHTKDQGEIVVRDAVTLKPLRSFRSYGKKPHDCRLDQSGETIIVANAARESSLVYINIADGKLLGKLSLVDKDKAMHSHFEISNDGWIIVGPRRNEARVNLVSPQREIFTLEHPKTTKPGVLSLAFIPQTELVVGTYPEANIVQIWNYKTRKVVESVSLPTPKGVLFDVHSKSTNPELYISLEYGKSLKKITIENNVKAIVTDANFKFGGTGAHLARTFS